tara:strand:+ start:217 stop:453 length:237 start_codon:yes stop_codon:yes gene_type:complete
MKNDTMLVIKGSLKFLGGCFVMIAAGAIITTSISKILSIPDVQFSYSSSECVKVLNYAEGDKYSCENLPAKFNNVWVK